MVDIQPATFEIRWGKRKERKKKEDRNSSCKWSALCTGGHKNVRTMLTDGVRQLYSMRQYDFTSRSSHLKSFR